MKPVDFDKTKKITTITEEIEDFGFGDPRLTVLTFAILFLVVIMLVLIGEQAIDTEKVFFRKVALRTNQKIADLISQQFAQVFSNTTGLLEDMSHFPSVVGKKHDLCNYLFDLILKRHSIFRAIYVLDAEDIAAGRSRPAQRDGKRWEWYNTNVRTYRPLTDDLIEDLKKGWVPSKLTNYYTIEGQPAITYVCAIRDRSTDKVVGMLAAEMKLAFIQPVIDGAELGKSGDVLVVDQRGSVIFSTRGFEDLEDFNKYFPVEVAYKNKQGGVEYKGVHPKLASYTRIRKMTTKPMIPGLHVLPFPSDITPREIPDWLIVVLQDAAEGYLVADRLKWNIVMLLMIGAVGVFIIGKLWVDSLR